MPLDGVLITFLLIKKIFDANKNFNIFEQVTLNGD